MVSRRLVAAAVVLVLVGSGTAYLTYQSTLIGAPSASTTGSGTSSSAAFLKPIKTIALPGISGRIDHMDVDPQSGRIFVAAYGGNEVVVVDSKSGSIVQTITGLSSPQSVLYVGLTNAIYVSNAADGTVKIYNGSSYALMKVLRFGGDADNMRYDPDSGTVYLGYGGGGIAAIDVRASQVRWEIPLPGHPESFQLAPNGMILVNVPAAGGVITVDTAKNSTSAVLDVPGGGTNFPMALDASSGKAYVGTRSPTEVVTIDTGSRRVLSSTSICGDADDLFLNPSGRLLYASCGDGNLDVIGLGAGAPTVLASVPTREGGRTSFLLAGASEIVVAAPSLGTQPAELLVFGI